MTNYYMNKYPLESEFDYWDEWDADCEDKTENFTDEEDYHEHKHMQYWDDFYRDCEFPRQFRGNQEAYVAYMEGWIYEDC